MPFENIGKTITGVKKNNKSITLSLSNGEKVEISPDVYSNNYFYVGKVMSTNDYHELKKEVAMTKLLTYAKSLLEKSMLTEWALREKLYHKEYEKSDIDSVIRILKKENSLTIKLLLKNMFLMVMTNYMAKIRLFRN